MKVAILATWEDYSGCSLPDLGADEYLALQINEERIETDLSVEIVYDSLRVKALLLEHEVTRLPCVIEINFAADPAASLSSSIVTDIPLIAYDDMDISTALVNGMDAFESFDLFSALREYTKVVHKCPHSSNAEYNMAALFHMLEMPTLAVHYTTLVLQHDQTDIIAHKFLWNLTQIDNKHVQNCCIRSYKTLAALGDITSSQKLATLTGEGQGAKRMDINYAREIYEDMGDLFEQKLVRDLGYTGPQILREMLDSCLTEETTLSTIATMGEWRVLDVGCGSGLVGTAFDAYVATAPKLSKDNTDTKLYASELNEMAPLLHAKNSTGSMLVGIDISTKMVEITKQKESYSSLACCDAIEAVKIFNTAPDIGESDGGTLDMVMAADTFIYIGELGEMFRASHGALKRGGYFLFSVEDLDKSTMRVQRDTDHVVAEGDATDVSIDAKGEIIGAVPGWGAELLTSSRFAHTNKYIETLAQVHNFRVSKTKGVDLRTESSSPIAGLMFVLQKQ